MVWRAAGLVSGQDPTLEATGLGRASSDASTYASGEPRLGGPTLDRHATVGRFQVEALIGTGGMGAVYRALDPQLGRPVALKLLHRAGDGSVAEAGQQRLLREAQAMARVAHPNLVMVFEVGDHEGHVYLAMELVEGQTLRGWLDAERRSVAAIVHVFSEAIRGLMAAHAAGLVHRDFKPANVLVSHTGRVQVTDFGLARATGVVDPVGPTRANDALAVHLTQTGALLGTPAYMAPEQFEGGPTDARTDEFAVCVALFEALYGQRPFRGDTTVALMSAVLSGRIVAPPPRREVPRPLYEVLVRGMARRPDDRFPDLASLLGAIERATRARTSALTVGVAVGAAGLLVLGAIALSPIGRSLWGDGEGDARAIESVPTPEPAASPKPAASSPKPAIDAVPTPAAALVAPEAGLRLLDEHYEHDQFLGSVSAWSGAAKDFAGACAQPQAPNRWCAAKEFCAGMVAFDSGDYREARARLDAATVLDDRWSAPHVVRAATLVQLGELDAALEAASEAQRLDPKWVRPLEAAAEVHLSANRFDDAVAELRRALELRPELATLHSQLALIHHAQGLDSEALRQAELALALDEDDLSALVLLTERALEDGELERALELATRASAVSPTNVPAWLARGDALALLGKPDDARSSYEKALANAKLVPDHGASAGRIEAVRVALLAGELPTPALSPGTRSKSSKPSSRPNEERSKKAEPRGDDLNNPLDRLDL